MAVFSQLQYSCLYLPTARHYVSMSFDPIMDGCKRIPIFETGAMF